MSILLWKGTIRGLFGMTIIRVQCDVCGREGCTAIDAGWGTKVKRIDTCSPACRAVYHAFRVQLSRVKPWTCGHCGVTHADGSRACDTNVDGEPCKGKRDDS